MSFGTFNRCKASYLELLMQLVLGYMEDLLILDVNFKLRKFVFFVSVSWLESGAFDFTSVVSCLAYFLWKALKWAVLARYLAELLTERQKLSPFMLVLPHSYRLLNQGEFLFLMEINFFPNLLYDGLKSTTSVGSNNFMPYKPFTMLPHSCVCFSILYVIFSIPTLTLVNDKPVLPHQLLLSWWKIWDVQMSFIRRELDNIFQWDASSMTICLVS